MASRCADGPRKFTGQRRRRKSAGTGREGEGRGAWCEGWKDLKGTEEAREMGGKVKDRGKEGVGKLRK